MTIEGGQRGCPHATVLILCCEPRGEGLNVVGAAWRWRQPPQGTARAAPEPWHPLPSRSLQWLNVVLALGKSQNLSLCAEMWRFQRIPTDVWHAGWVN